MATQTPTRPVETGKVSRHVPRVPHLHRDRLPGQARDGMSLTMVVVTALVMLLVGFGTGVLFAQGDTAELDTATSQVTALQQENADLVASLDKALAGSTGNSVAPVGFGTWSVLAAVEAADDGTDVFTASFPVRNNGTVTDSTHFGLALEWDDDITVGSTTCATPWMSPGTSQTTSCTAVPLGSTARFGVTDVVMTRLFGHL